MHYKHADKDGDVKELLLQTYREAFTCTLLVLVLRQGIRAQLMVIDQFVNSLIQ